MAIELPGAPGPAPAGDVLEGRVIPPRPDTSPDLTKPAPAPETGSGRRRKGRSRAWERPRRPEDTTPDHEEAEERKEGKEDAASPPAPRTIGRWYRSWSRRTTTPNQDRDQDQDAGQGGRAAPAPVPRPAPEPAPPAPPVRDLPVSTGGPIHVHVTIEHPEHQAPGWRRLRAWLRAWARPRQTFVAALLAFTPAWNEGHSIASAWAAAVQDARVEASVGGSYVLALGALAVVLLVDWRTQGWIWRTALLVALTGSAAVVSPWDLVGLMTGVWK